MRNIISNVYAREILDSRGNPTVEAEVWLSGGAMGRGIVPSGASTGMYEAHELRDEDSKRFRGKGVLKAVSNINTILCKVLSGADVLNQRQIDKAIIETDDSPNKQTIGANAMLAVSMACANAAAAAMGMPLYRYLGGVTATHLPVPMMNILNGGAHAANNVDIQEFMIVPVGATSFAEGLRACSEVYHKLADILRKRKMSVAVGDEGGFAPDLRDDTEAMELILTAIELAGYRIKDDFLLALDVAASEWTVDGGYLMPKHNIKYTTGDLIKNWINMCARYPIMSLEDPLGENDLQGWQKLTADLKSNEADWRIRVVGDDLFVTDKKRLAIGIEKKCANSILIKLNQIGTVSETLDTIALARKAGYSYIISHRSGETEDSFIADFAVAAGAAFIKSGAPARSERVAKYNRLLRIEDELKLH